MLPGEHQQVLSNLQSHFDEFLEDSEESEVFTVADCAQLESDVLACKDFYQQLLESAERGEKQPPTPALLALLIKHCQHVGNTWLLKPSKLEVNAFWNYVGVFSSGIRGKL